MSRGLGDVYKRQILICGVGGQAALTGKTLIEMGYKNVLNVGGIPDWEKNGGPMKKY